MQLAELILLSVGLAMDAFAVSICKGLATGKQSFRGAGLVGLWFGGFQALMPLIGFFVGSRFRKQIESVDHWVVFALLAFIGLNMIREAIRGEEDGRASSTDFGFRTMFLLALATSIDALAVGISLALLQVNIAFSAGVIGAITFAVSAAGFFIGNAFGTRYRRPAQIAGGAILVILGIKTLLEHLLA